MDPESAFLASTENSGNEWEVYKENVRPLKRGRNVTLLNHALKSHSNPLLKNYLLQTRRNLIEAVDQYNGDDPLLPWLECIKWVQDSFPPGGDCSGLVVIYEQCVRAFWHSERYKDDLRYLKVWLEYAESCADAQVIYSFLDANGIGKTHSIYYIAYASYLESKSKMKAANDIFTLGISRNSQPIEKLNNAYRKFLVRSMRAPKVVEEDGTESHLPSRSFGTILSNASNRSQSMENSDLFRKKLKSDRPQKAPYSIYKDTKIDGVAGHAPGKSSTDSNPWNTIGTRAERNKENNAAPARWSTYKIPRRPGGVVGGGAQTACIEVFVDEECAETNKSQNHETKSSTLQLRQGDEHDLKKETELLRENPLRNFPLSSLPR